MKVFVSQLKDIPREIINCFVISIVQHFSKNATLSLYEGICNVLYYQYFKFFYVVMKEIYGMYKFELK